MVQSKRMRSRTAKAISSQLPLITAFAVILGWMDVTLLSVPVLQPILSTLFLLLVPGFFLHRIIAERSKGSLMRTIVNAVGLSILTIMVTGLAWNQLAPLLWLSNPLTAQSLVWVFGAVTALLACFAHIRTPLQLPKRPSLRRIRSLLRGLPLIIPPVLAIGGATTLNNAGGSWLALTALGLSLAIMIAVAWSRRRFKRGLPYVLYSTALTILLGTALRGWNITGHDVMQEFQVFELTVQHHVWNMAFYQDAYNACLSITILPTVLQQLTGIADQYVFKAIFPLFVGLIVPALYLTIRPYASRKVAFLAAGIFISFSPFVLDFTMLNRQTTAFLFMLLAIQAGLNRRLASRPQTLLVFLFLVGMILSHYSTSYVGLGMLLITTFLGIAIVLFSRLFLKKKISGAFAIFRPTVIVAALMVLLLWNTFATETSNNVKQTIQGVVNSIPALLAGKGIEPSPSRTGSAGTDVLPEYITSLTETRTLPTADYYPNVTTDSVQESTGSVQAVNPILAKAGVTEALLSKIYSTIKSFYTVGVLGIAAIGLFIMLRRRHGRMPLQYVLLGFSGLMIIGLQLVLPSSAINYGLLRIVQQSLLVLSLPIIVAILAILRLLRLRYQHALRVTVCIIAFVLLVMIGALSTITGGDKPALAFNNAGFYYQAYLTHDTDIAADKWLKQNTPVGSRVYSDEFERRQLMAYSSIFSEPTIVPQALPVDSYVYVSTNNTQFGVVPFYYLGELSYYSVPYRFLDTHKNLVYSSGGVDIYK